MGSFTTLKASDGHELQPYVAPAGGCVGRWAGGDPGDLRRERAYPPIFDRVERGVEL